MRCAVIVANLRCWLANSYSAAMVNAPLAMP
jgi:hypothetical protein